MSNRVSNRVFALSAIMAALLVGVGSSLMLQAEEGVPVKYPELSTLKSFEIRQFHDTYDTETAHVDPETFSYLGTALQKEASLPKASPAEGIIDLNCVDRKCHYIEAKVYRGAEGPVLWQSKLRVYWTYGVSKDPREVAEQLITQLATDYRAR